MNESHFRLGTSAPQEIKFSIVIRIAMKIICHGPVRSKSEFRARDFRLPSPVAL